YCIGDPAAVRGHFWVEERPEMFESLMLKGLMGSGSVHPMARMPGMVHLYPDGGCNGRLWWYHKVVLPSQA
ncbi:MAG: hypothetical protein MPL62_13655, partial [Alphaproteobacteria bacterium]|nr:hypothetical protein [Alphaproteobacteria bacterium]